MPELRNWYHQLLPVNLKKNIKS